MSIDYPITSTRPWEETHIPKVVGSNPSTVYWIDIFFKYICCKNCNVCLKRQKINEKEAEVGPFLKNTSTRAEMWVQIT